ncbi:SDR family oxidoreductase [Novosphingobium sp. G106]|uniref:SDR family NAD(P)-dependent oxidoreductase n=1 Tax=Novosphingobium sp. G106 TaxID=2849500 RepID=UPI001C2DE870|nr:SDR family oxidoreductase [Novosphingobium sp. G106]MBV1686664.1 SDR family oxidoreductase [Novosphingobium sp. G106]
MERQKELDLTGKVVIVTGASRGVGKQAALDFARRGARVVLAARTVDPDPTLPGSMGETLKEIEALGGEALAVQTDIARQADLKKLVDTTVERFGGIDVLVNNAASTVGSVWSKKFADLTFAEWTNDFDINLHAPFTLMQLVTPIMAARGGGRIINVTTGSGEVFRMTEEHVPPSEVVGRNLVVPSYFASKRALDRLSNVIAPELRKDNVYVIGLHPGWVATEIVSKRLEAQGFDPKEGDNRPVLPTVPARMIVYFSSCENPNEYTGRLFWAEREMADMGVSFDPTVTEGRAEIELAETRY